MGGIDDIFSGILELLVRYHSGKVRNLKTILESERLTVSGGQFYWGGSLLKSNGGVQRFSRVRRKLTVECKGIRELDCKTYKSSRDESRP